jgi:hypothetical protein
LTSLTWMIRRILMQIDPSKTSSDYSPTMCNTLQNVSEWCWKRQCSSNCYSTPNTVKIISLYFSDVLAKNSENITTAQLVFYQAKACLWTSLDVLPKST